MTELPGVNPQVELADTKGEYMALLRALRKALGRENNARAKLEELERVMSVMAPGGPGAQSLGFGGDEFGLPPIRTWQPSPDEAGPEDEAKQGGGATGGSGPGEGAGRGEGHEAQGGPGQGGEHPPPVEEGEIQPA